MKKDIYDELKTSAEEIEVPEELQPDVIEAMLEEEAARETRAQDTYEKQDPLPSQVISMGEGKKNIRWKKSYSAALAVAMAAIVVLPAILQPWASKEEREPIAWVDPEPPVETGESKSQTLTASVGDFGDTLHNPSSYREIYDAIQETNVAYEDAFVTESVEDADGFSLFGGAMDESKEAVMEESQALDIAPENNAASKEYSKTNTREENVAEGDVTITDGRYIYHFMAYGTVEILGTEDGVLTEEAVINFNELGDSTDLEYINDMYIQDGKLIVIGEAYHTVLKQNAAKTNEIQSENDVMAVVYDVSDVKHPKFLGSTSYDGMFFSSRLVGDVLYVFTQSDPPYHLYDMVWEENSHMEEEIVPKINDEVAELDRIYMPANYQTQSSFTMSSVKLSKPSKVLDYRVIMGYTSDIYVADKAIYLQSVDYSGSVNRTALVRMNYASGKFTPAGVGVVKGALLDAFAIDEDADGNLRVATTVVTYDNGTNRSNQLTIFDARMEEIGKLSGLARGEEIKSARYIGDYCYLVTFENTDPLFTIDCSDPTEPIMVGELKMPGFSDYLHPWNGDQLLGFGCNGDEYGLSEGLKLTMFDISNPADVEILDEQILKDADDAQALEEYKALFVAPDRGLVGFAVRSWNDERQCQYRIYRYGEDGFELEFAVDIDPNEWNMRGLYIGDDFYLVGDSQASSYDMNNHYKKQSELEW
ncbi:MAG: beta-propeller domain-containing protein [Lachnospiraceae bacterium]|nr:beta-propeller domain-containing protein [Lachnospiraceae bacterium]